VGAEGIVHWERSINRLQLPAFAWGRRWGIGVRLGIAFAAVAGLAVAANLLIQQEIWIKRTTRVVRVGEPPSRSAAPVVPPSISAPLPPAEIQNAKPLIAAIEHYEAAVRSRIEFHGDDTARRVAASDRELAQELRTYASLPDGAEGDSRLAILRVRLADYMRQGNEMVRAADRRQNVLNEFWSRFEALDARTKGSLGRSWKIFGRVIARKSLVDLNSHLDEIRRSFAGLAMTGRYDQQTLDEVRLSERELRAGLETNASILSSSQGEAWVRQATADLAQITALQESLVGLDNQRRGAESEFSNEARNLISLAGTTRTAMATHQPADVPAIIQPSAAGASTAPGVIDIAATSHSGAAAVDVGTETSSITLEKAKSFPWIFWVSAGVLVLLSWISIGTMLSVVIPVRRMRLATSRLAGGEAGVKVKRGGIRELDELALSFNQMAEHLAEAQAVARNYQQRLEAQVDLRTRELQHLAEHDSLTQLPNRRQLFTHLQSAITHAQANRSRLGVFFVDLDNFKNINDSMGHAFGDRVLGAIAKRLRARVGATGYAARLGGDEFTVVFDPVMDVDGLSSIGWDLVHAFQLPVAVDGRYLMISISVGASLYPDHGSDTAALLSAADAALFRAKRSGRSQLAVFSAELLEEASAKFTIEQGLRYALERSEFELVFQPEVNATTLKTHLVEALLRWRQPDGRLAPPSEFLGVAEESGLIMEISDWVLRTSIETAARWYHGAWPQARVAINLSSRQLLDTRFVDRVTGLLREYRLPAHCIEIELTENVLQTGPETIDVLHQLREHGVSIALDDFGTGYSSLASLEGLPLTRVKLDRTLVAAIHLNARSAAIARALVGLCHSIDLDVTAEGVECREQLALLSELAPISLQGFLLARPVSAEKLLGVIASLPDQVASLLLTTSPVTLLVAPDEPVGPAQRSNASR
jgi:diguanylate cyclase (GGDEF)-like protein